MGRPPQCAARLHFRAAGLSRQGPHGAGHCEYWRARTGGTAQSFTGWCCISCAIAGRSTSRCFARCEAKPQCFSCSTRCFVATRTSYPTSCIIADYGCDITGNISCFVTGSSSSSFDCYFACDGSSCFPGFVAAKGIGTTDLERIEVRGLSIADAAFPYGHFFGR